MADLGISINFSDHSIKDLESLNHQLVDHLKLRQQREAQKEMINFEMGDTVSFLSSDGEVIRGEIVRFNQKSISLKTYDNRKWRVSPHLLSKVVVSYSSSMAKGVERKVLPESAEVLPSTSIADLNPLKKLGRNSRCPCGSGKKYKRCCS